MQKNESVKKTKILILKLGAIGDVVMALSLITAIEQKYPGAEITWVCGKIVEPVLSALKKINTLITVDEHKFYKNGLRGKISAISDVWRALKGKRFDIAINCYRSKMYKLLLLPVRSNVYLDFSGRDRTNSFIPGRYHADEYARIILGTDDWQLKNMKFPKINLDGNSEIKQLIKDIPSPKIILAPGGTKNILRSDDLRRWHVENYKELARKLLEQNPSVILVGAESDGWVTKEFIGINVVNLIGKTSLLDMIRLFTNADVLVTHDTGTLHLAKLSDINIIALFGPVNPKERIGVNENAEIFWGGKKLPCSPCYDGRNFADCNNNICMKNISVEEVFERIVNKLKTEKRK
ncbi:MAG: glycosyltransferase family 9 protein [Ignavibacteriales bacterium]|nr:glycosyltransferase family 9 protein [Ignavibacteriales bacterium]